MWVHVKQELFILSDYPSVPYVLMRRMVFIFNFLWLFVFISLSW